MLRTGVPVSDWMMAFCLRGGIMSRKLSLCLAVFLFALGTHNAGANLEVADTVAVGDSTQPLGIDVDLSTGKVYVASVNPVGFNNDSIYVIDGTTREVIKAIAGGDTPQGVAVSQANGKVYVTHKHDPVFVVQVSTDSVVNDTLHVGTWPEGVAVNPNGNKIYVANPGSFDVSVIDGNFDTLITTIEPYYAGCAYVAVNAVTNRVYATDDVGGIGVINAVTDSETTHITFGPGATGLATDPVNDRVYVANSIDGTVGVVDGTADTMMAEIKVGSTPIGVAVNATKNEIYVANSGGNTISVINGSTFEVIQTLPVGDTPSFIAVDESTQSVYVTCSGDGTVWVLEWCVGVEDSQQSTVHSPQFSVLPNPSTSDAGVSFNFKLSTVDSGPWTLTIYDIAGKMVKNIANGKRESGNYNVNWKAGNLPAGIYFAKLQGYQTDGRNFNEIRKFILAK
jgi:YVTN family beta-propeller protein